jgi:hypothetical protein
MNPQFRTVALIAAVLGLLLSLFLVLRPSDDKPAAPGTTAAQTTNGETTSAPETMTAQPPDVVTIRVTVTGDTAPAVRHFSVQQGRHVQLVVASDIADEVHVHGYDLMGDVAPGQPVTISFKATAPGRFEIELEEHSLPIAELEVRP